ncbi:hypothetical protein CRG98_038229 [Punica granatum]|uniref:Uncharacterized protein n=1 Tax=Punica granatum TaxID=22663 RepID=A0A2I0IBZ7_PUNGR|nr:hypothetical protein CRG98_038229 [Punica granatum]
MSRAARPGCLTAGQARCSIGPELPQVMSRSGAHVGTRVLASMLGGTYEFGRKWQTGRWRVKYLRLRGDAFESYENDSMHKNSDHFHYLGNSKAVPSVPILSWSNIDKLGSYASKGVFAHLSKVVVDII